MYTADPSAEERHAALLDTVAEYHHAMLTTSGGEPQTSKMALKDPAWDEPVNGWCVRELEEVKSLFDMGVLEWVPVSEVPKSTRATPR